MASVGTDASRPFESTAEQQLVRFAQRLKKTLNQRVIANYEDGANAVVCQRGTRVSHAGCWIGTPERAGRVMFGVIGPMRPAEKYADGLPCPVLRVMEGFDMRKTLTGASVAALGALFLLAAQPAESKTAAKSESVTLTGCLQADGGKYKLTDLQGEKAPKGRSWKTGFITKSTKNVEVSTTAAGPKLKDHIGHEVTLTGVRNGETHLQAKSLKHVAAKCS